MKFAGITPSKTSFLKEELTKNLMPGRKTNTSTHHKLLLPAFILCFCFCSLFSLSLSHAEDPSQEEAFLKGKQLFEELKYKEAYDEFFHAFKQDPGNLDISFYLGRAAFGMKDYEIAIMTFDRILIMDPEAIRIKLELARSHFELGSFEAAKTYFIEVLAADPPENVKKNIEFFLDVMKKAEKKHILSGVFTAGINWDDNIKSAPLSTTTEVLGFELELTGDTATPKEDQIMNSTIMLNHIYKVPDRNIAWKTILINYNALYQDQVDLDINYLGINSGPVWKTDAFMWDIYGLATQTYLDDEKYLVSNGIASNFILTMDPVIQIKLGAKSEKKQYPQDTSKDATNTTFSIGPMINAGVNTFGFTLSFEDEGADGPENSYDRHNATLTYSRKLLYNFTFNFKAGLKMTDYREANILYGVKRSDMVKTHTSGFTRIFYQSPDRSRSMSATASYTYTKSESNIDIYSYKKDVLAASMTLMF